MWGRFPVLAMAFAAFTAGCLSPEGRDLQLLDDEQSEGVFVAGVVIDPELLPIEGATVSSGDNLTQTSAGGEFRLGPLEPGTYAVAAERTGYSSVAMEIVVGSESPPRIILQLSPTAADVPYFEVEQHASIIGCAVATPTGRMTCGLLAQLTGVTPVADSSVFPFVIPKAGLALLLVETTWQPGTAFARQLSVNVLDQEGDQSNCVTTACYSEQVGEAPVRIEFLPGMRWQDMDPYQPFPGEEGHAFNVYLMPPFGTAEVPLLLYVDQRTDTFLTFFYNRVGSPDFTALPDT